jgi:Tfp pilus assembly protein PilF
MKIKWGKVIPWAAVILGVFTAGCASSKQEARKQAVARWQQVRTGVTAQMAEQQLQKGQPERARESLVEALRGNPDDPQLHLLMARAQFELGDLTAAQAELARARCLAPRLAEVDYWQGILAQAAGAWEEAHAAYLVACAKAPDSPEYLCALLEARLALGRPQDVIAATSGRFRDFPTDARLRLLTAAAHVQLDDLAKAQAAYEQAIALDPSSEEAKEGLAQVLYQSGKYEQAAAVLESLPPEPTPGRKDMRPLLAACHVACGRYDRAERLYESCLANDPDQMPLRWKLYEVRLLSGHAARVRHDLQALLDKRPGDAQGWELLGHACTRAAQCGGLTERLQPYVAAIDRQSRDSDRARPSADRDVQARAVTRVEDDAAR